MASQWMRFVDNWPVQEKLYRRSVFIMIRIRDLSPMQVGGTLFINTAKTTAGSPGNLAHEVAHTLGYSHFSNRRLFGMSSVPYRIGDLVAKLVNALDR